MDIDPPLVLPNDPREHELTMSDRRYQAKIEACQSSIFWYTLGVLLAFLYTVRILEIYLSWLLVPMVFGLCLAVFIRTRWGEQLLKRLIPCSRYAAAAD